MRFTTDNSPRFVPSCRSSAGEIGGEYCECLLCPVPGPEQGLAPISSGSKLEPEKEIVEYIEEPICWRKTDLSISSQDSIGL